MIAEIVVTTSSGRDWLDLVALVLEVVGLLVTALGLFFVVRTLRATERQQKTAQEEQRTAAGPYIRVDIGSLELDPGDFEPPDFVFHDGTQAANLLEGQKSGVTFVAWFRNRQTHPLGMALAVQAQFVVESPRMATSCLVEVAIAYVEHNRPVVVDIVEFPEDWDVRATLIYLSYQDFYDRRQVHYDDGEGTNGLHGRLECHYEAGTITSLPHGWPRGAGVDFQADKQKD
jgi:hypothetical protein